MTNLQDYYERSYSEQVRLKNQAIKKAELEVNEKIDNIDEVVVDLIDELENEKRSFNPGY